MAEVGPSAYTPPTSSLQGGMDEGLPRVTCPLAPAFDTFERRMQIVALSPVLASRLVWRREAERWALTVVVKATFDVVPGEVRPSSQLAPVYGADVHEGGHTAHPLI